MPYTLRSHHRNTKIKQDKKEKCKNDITLASLHGAYLGNCVAQAPPQ
jgi:hypothetical protein